MPKIIPADIDIAMESNEILFPLKIFSKNGSGNSSWEYCPPKIIPAIIPTFPPVNIARKQ